MPSPTITLALKVAIIAGGGRPEINYHSHLTHVRGLVELLDARGVPREDLAVFWADGQSDAPDRAVRTSSAEVPGDWVLQETPLDALTSIPVTQVDTTADDLLGIRALPARRKHLQAWLRKVRGGLAAGDTLAIVVTDHGEPDPDEKLNTRIVLWEEHLTKNQLLDDLKVVSEDVRVLLWMSQCFAGGFADLANSRRNTCGAFAANDDQVAYGCFPDLAGRQDIGHFVHMLAGTRATGTLAGASDRAMLTDDTPDSPHLSRDLYLTETLGEIATSRGLSFDALVDLGLQSVPADAPERVLGRKIGEAYGLGAMETSTAMAERLSQIEDLLHASQTFDRLWTPALTEARRWLVRDFKVDTKGSLAAEEKAVLRAAFVRRLSEKAVADPPFEQALLALHDRRLHLGESAARLEIQSAATRRVGDLLARAAAPHLLSPEERARLDALRACEETPWLPAAVGAVEPEAARSPFPEPLTSLEVTEARIFAARPGYYGVQYAEVKPAKGEPAGQKPEGAVRVEAVTPKGPADQAGLRVGDIVLAVDGETLGRPGRYRETAFFSKPGVPRTLSLLRAGQPMALTLVPGPFPLAPRPPVEGERVPTLALVPQSGPLPALGQGRPVVLLFWATWCGPCKRSLPRLAEWAKTHGADVIAITNEDEKTVTKFLEKFGAFPFPIAFDRGGVGDLFGATAFPTFVLVDEDGFYARRGLGYDGDRLPIEAESPSIDPKRAPR
ncbi:MAG: redoxin family protein [Bradymonadia bacterium]